MPTRTAALPRIFAYSVFFYFSQLIPLGVTTADLLSSVCRCRPTVQSILLSHAHQQPSSLIPSYTISRVVFFSFNLALPSVAFILLPILWLVNSVSHYFHWTGHTEFCLSLPFLSCSYTTPCSSSPFERLLRFQGRPSIIWNVTKTLWRVNHYIT